MRSRYAAYARGEMGYVFRTWHPRTRPDMGELDHRQGADATAWTGLTIHGSGEDWVDFTAAYDGGELRERSRFERRRGRWVYVDGDVT
jgi:SEC-C motif-containing protein